MTSVAVLAGIRGSSVTAIANHEKTCIIVDSNKYCKDEDMSSTDVAILCFSMVFFIIYVLAIGIIIIDYERGDIALGMIIAPFLIVGVIALLV